MQDWQRHIYGCWLPTITGGTHSEGSQLKSKSTFLLVIAFPPSHCVCTACVHVCPRVDVCEVGTKFNDTEISQPGLAIRLAPNIDSFNPVCYNFKWSLWLRKSQRINPALSSLSVCRWGHRVLFLLWIPEYFVLLQRLDWAPNSINIHDSCIAHKHTHARGDGVSGTDLTRSLTAEWVLWWTEAI